MTKQELIKEVRGLILEADRLGRVQKESGFQFMAGYYQGEKLAWGRVLSRLKKLK